MRNKSLWKIILAAMLGSCLMAGNAFAGEWRTDSGGWWYRNDDGSYPTGSWKWIDGNGDGSAECYYFDGRGYCMTGATTPDGYQVDSNGAWVVNGIVQRQAVSVPWQAAERKALNRFLSNFSEAGMYSFDSADYSDAELIRFAIGHADHNDDNRINDSGGYAKIPADAIADAVEKYFGIRIKHQSVGEDGQMFYCKYSDGYYYFVRSAGSGDPLRWSQVTSLSRNGDGTFLTNVDIYAGHTFPDNIYEDIEDWNLTSGMKITPRGEKYGDVWSGPCYSWSAVAVIAPYTHQGTETYRLISLKPVQ